MNSTTELSTEEINLFNWYAHYVFNWVTNPPFSYRSYRVPEVENPMVKSRRERYNIIVQSPRSHACLQEMKNLYDEIYPPNPFLQPKFWDPKTQSWVSKKPQ